MGGVRQSAENLPHYWSFLNNNSQSGWCLFNLSLNWSLSNKKPSKWDVLVHVCHLIGQQNQKTVQLRRYLCDFDSSHKICCLIGGFWNKSLLKWELTVFVLFTGGCIFSTAALIVIGCNKSLARMVFVYIYVILLINFWNFEWVYE